MAFAFSRHAEEQMELRGITHEQVETVLRAPDRLIREEQGQVVYQKVIFPENEPYLIRVFVNAEKDPPFVKTVYRTSKIAKYQ